MVFDPFKDFASAGYLRNFAQERDLNIVKRAEHALCRANLSDAVGYLRKQKKIEYRHFLQVHGILFQGLYPWAGKDRASTNPDTDIVKGEIRFCSPRMIKAAIEEGLRLGQDHHAMRTNPGEVLGYFAYGHPFLECNGRTMLLVHSELCRRAGFSIDWAAICKEDYLHVLTREIENPGTGILDQYLQQFVGTKQASRD